MFLNAVIAGRSAAIAEWTWQSLRNLHHMHGVIVAIHSKGTRSNRDVRSEHDRFINPGHMQNAKELPDRRIIIDIVRDESIPAAGESLLIWGMINFVVWFVLYAKVIDLLRRIGVQSEVSTVSLYGGCAIALGMLAFGMLGYYRKSIVAGYMQGIWLVIAGLWNIHYNIAVANIIRVAGYELTEKGINGWKLLGLIQCIWGVLQIYGFYQFGFQPRRMDKEIKNSALTKLRAITRGPEQPNAGRFKISIPNSLLRSIVPGMRHGGPYTIWLLPDKACCLHDNLIDYYEYDRRTITVTQIHNSIEHRTGGNIKVRIDSASMPHTADSIVLNESAFKTFKEWSGTEG